MYTPHTRHNIKTSTHIQTYEVVETILKEDAERDSNQSKIIAQTLTTILIFVYQLYLHIFN